MFSYTGLCISSIRIKSINKIIPYIMVYKAKIQVYVFLLMIPCFMMALPVMATETEHGKVISGMLTLENEPVYHVVEDSCTVTGTVVDEFGVPLPGVNVVVEGTVVGTITDIDGNYSIELPECFSGVLLFSYITYKVLEVEVYGGTIVDVMLEPDWF